MNAQASGFDRGARATLAFVLLLLIFSLAIMVYRFTLPYDGWITKEPEEINPVGYIYVQNVLGLPSGLQVGDHLIAVEGISLEKLTPDFSLFKLSPQWRAGDTMRYTVLRQGQEVNLLVPLANPLEERKLITGGSITNTTILGLLGIASFFTMGLITFIKRPDNPAARAMLVLGTVWISVQLISAPTQIQDEIFPGAAIPIFLLFSAAFTMFIPPAFIRFGLVFPRPKPILSRLPWIAYIPYGVGSISMLLFLNGVYIFGWISMAASVLITIFLLAHNAFTMRDAVSRAQLGWGLGGMMFGLGIFLTTVFPIFIPVSQPVEDFFSVLGSLGLTVMGATLTIAILRYRLFDIDVIIRRTLQYGLLSLLLGLVYFGLVLLLGQAFQSASGQESPLAVVLSTLAIAALFTPLRRRLQTIIDRRFYRQKYDSARAMEEFSAVARLEVELDVLTQRLTAAVQESLQPERITLWLKKEEGDP
ncbi:MAG: hypothetical protein HY835_08860 [Anaerolineae bacterium]|nr:hypothetical protein [Anaerolineae bacterium]